MVVGTLNRLRALRASLLASLMTENTVVGARRLSTWSRGGRSDNFKECQ